MSSTVTSWSSCMHTLKILVHNVIFICYEHLIYLTYLIMWLFDSNNLILFAYYVKNTLTGYLFIMESGRLPFAPLHFLVLHVDFCQYVCFSLYWLSEIISSLSHIYSGANRSCTLPCEYQGMNLQSVRPLK